MKVKAEKTALATWECPICNAENTEFLLEDKNLPDELQCSFCGHESGLIRWIA